MKGKEDHITHIVPIDKHTGSKFNPEKIRKQCATLSDHNLELLCRIALRERKSRKEDWELAAYKAEQERIAKSAAHLAALKANPPMPPTYPSREEIAARVSANIAKMHTPALGLKSQVEKKGPINNGKLG